MMMITKTTRTKKNDEMINHTPPSSYLHMIGIQIPRIIMTQGSRYIVLITGIIVIVAITPMKIMA